MKSPLRSLSLATALLAVGAPAAFADAETWSCSNGQRYTAVYDNDRLVLSNRSARYTLLPRRAGSGSLYAGGGIRFHEKGRNAVMSFPGGGQVRCTRARTEARRNDEMDPNQPCGPGYRKNAQGDCVSRYRQPGDALPAQGRSWGGIVRSGPSQSSPRVAVLREGEPVTILADTGVTWNNYRWFRIRFRGRRIGFQWGGILCGRRAPIPGAYKVCN